MPSVLGFLMVILVLIGTGCAPAAPASPTPGDQPTGIPTRSSTPTSEAASWAALHSGATIVYSRGGGITGKTEGWAFYADGLVVARTGQEGRVDPAEVTALVSQAESAGFYTWQDSYVSGSVCCDRKTYELTLRSNGRAKTVRTIDGAEREPDLLRPLIGEIDRLAQQAIPHEERRK